MLTTRTVGTMCRPVVFAGVDWGGSFHQLCLIDGAGTVLVQQRIDHDVTGLALLAARLRRPAGAGRDRTGRGSAGGVPADAAVGHGVLRVAEDLGPGAGAVPDVGGEVGQLRRVRAGRHAASRARSVAAAAAAVTVDRAAAGGVPGSAAGAARQGGMRVPAAGGPRDLSPRAAAPVLRVGPRHHVGVHPRLSHP